MSLKITSFTYYVVLSILTALFPFFALSQNSHDEGHEHGNEMSVAAGYVPLPAEDENTLGLHFHYIRGLGESKRFGMGLGFETIIDEHKHYTFSVVGQYRIAGGWTVAYAPGMMIRQEDSETLYQIAHHFETAYEFELGSFHIGPMAEVGVEEIGVHYMAGVHFGIEF